MASQAENGAVQVSAPESLLVMFARMHDLVDLAVARCVDQNAGSSTSRSVREGWDVASTRLMPVMAQLCDPQMMASLEDDLVTAGLLGPELDAKAVLFDIALGNVIRDDGVAALHIAATLCYAASRVPGFAADLRALGDFAAIIADVLPIGSDPADRPLAPVAADG